MTDTYSRWYLPVQRKTLEIYTTLVPFRCQADIREAVSGKMVKPDWLDSKAGTCRHLRSSPHLDLTQYQKSGHFKLSSSECFCSVEIWGNFGKDWILEWLLPKRTCEHSKTSELAGKIALNAKFHELHKDHVLSDNCWVFCLSVHFVCEPLRSTITADTQLKLPQSNSWLVLNEVETVYWPRGIHMTQLWTHSHNTHSVRNVTLQSSIGISRSQAACTNDVVGVSHPIFLASFALKFLPRVRQG